MTKLHIVTASFVLSLLCSVSASAQTQADVTFLKNELEIIRESIAMSIAMNSADVSTNKRVKVSLATGIYDEAVGIAGMIGYRHPAMPGFTFRGGVAYGVDKEQYGGTFGFAASW